LFFFSSRRRHTRFSRDWSSDVCSSDLQQHQTAGGVEAVQLDQQLVEGLFLLVVTAAQRPGATGAAEGVQLVDEDDRRGLGARLRSEERRVGKECRARWWRSECITKECY